MGPHELTAPANPLGYPAPYWFLAFFKVLGFTLHALPMSLWYAGIFLALFAYWLGGPLARVWSRRLMERMPIIVALGINFGIIPLLFLQTAYYKVFYSATILMAWPWFAIIPMLTLAYYGVYLYVVGLRSENLRALHKAAGWVSAVLFTVIGFFFANAFSLMVNVSGWGELWRKTNLAGAALGTALNTGDPTLWPRWLMMIGLAICTVSAYTVFDAAFWASREGDEYKRWAGGFALKVHTVGLLWFASMGSWYVFGTWPADVREGMFSGAKLLLTAVTAISPGIPWFFILLQRRGVTRALAAAAGAGQFAAIAVNAVSRQLVQNIHLSLFVDVAAEPVKVQWSPIVVFLVMFAIGVAILVWIALKLVEAERRSQARAT